MWVSNLFRWICVSAMAALGCLVYSIVLCLGIKYLCPGHLGFESSPGAADLTQPAFWRYALMWGAFAGVVVGPYIGFSVIKDVNQTVTDPQEDAAWWGRSHIMMFWAFAIIGGVALTLGALLFSLQYFRGGTWKEAGHSACHGLVWGTIIGAFGFGMGRQFHRTED